MSNADPVITPAQQAVFAVGAFAGLSSGVTGDDPDLATFQLISTGLGNAASAIGTWNIAWGPSVVMQPIGPAVAMNTMYVARSAADPSQYVIAIAGTNPKSIVDWIVEDGFVHWQVPWVYAPVEARGARIALGTAIVDAPSGPSDPRGPELVARITAELRKHGAPSPAGPG